MDVVRLGLRKFQFQDWVSAGINKFCIATAKAHEANCKELAKKLVESYCGVVLDIAEAEFLQVTEDDWSCTRANVRHIIVQYILMAQDCCRSCARNTRLPDILIVVVFDFHQSSFGLSVEHPFCVGQVT